MFRSVGIYPLTFWTSTFLVIYFLPFIIARWRGHSRSVQLGFLNFLLGWTIMAWVVSLVWALCDPCQHGYSRRCPHCAEMVGNRNRTCDFCGNELVYVQACERICLMCKAANSVKDTYCSDCCSRLL